MESASPKMESDGWNVLDCSVPLQRCDFDKCGNAERTDSGVTGAEFHEPLSSQDCDEKMSDMVKMEHDCEDVITSQELDEEYSCPQEDSTDGISLSVKEGNCFINNTEDEVMIKQELEIGPTVLQPKSTPRPVVPALQASPAPSLNTSFVKSEEVSSPLCTGNTAEVLDYSMGSQSKTSDIENAPKPSTRQSTQRSRIQSLSACLKKKKHLTDGEMLHELVNLLKESVEPTDPFYSFSCHIANELRNYDADTLSCVKHAINNLIAEASKGRFPQSQNNHVQFPRKRMKSGQSTHPYFPLLRVRTLRLLKWLDDPYASFQ